MATSNYVGMQLRDRPEFTNKPKPLTFPPDATVSEAVDAMCAMRKLVHQGHDHKSTKLTQIMTHDPRVARETDDVVDWLRIMSNDRFRRLPVVDDQGRI